MSALAATPAPAAATMPLASGPLPPAGNEAATQDIDLASIHVLYPDEPTFGEEPIFYDSDLGAPPLPPDLGAPPLPPAPPAPAPDIRVALQQHLWDMHSIVSSIRHSFEELHIDVASEIAKDILNASIAAVLGTYVFCYFPTRKNPTPLATAEPEPNRPEADERFLADALQPFAAKVKELLAKGKVTGEVSALDTVQLVREGLALGLNEATVALFLQAISMNASDRVVLKQSAEQLGLTASGMRVTITSTPRLLEGSPARLDSFSCFS